jgi:hypothetical protein
MRQYSGSISTPTLLRSYLSAATIVVPEPQNGSNTVSSVKRKHPNQAHRKLQWIRRRMVLQGSPGKIPYLLKPFAEVLFFNHALLPLQIRRFAVSPRLSLH